MEYILTVKICIFESLLWVKGFFLLLPGNYWTWLAWDLAIWDVFSVPLIRLEQPPDSINWSHKKEVWGKSKTMNQHVFFPEVLTSQRLVSQYTFIASCWGPLGVLSPRGRPLFLQGSPGRGPLVFQASVPSAYFTSLPGTCPQAHPGRVKSSVPFLSRTLG